jgi:hypothetical protein
MTVEVFRNLAETTLASGYTSGGVSISVASASGFPTTGVFRVALGNAGRTIYRVDSVSGTTFTGGAEEFDANASTGTTVTLAASRAVAERFLQTPESGEANARSGIAGIDETGPFNWKLTRLDQSSWSWVNQGSAVVTQSGGLVKLITPTAGGTNVRARVKTVPSVPYTVEVGVIGHFQLAASVTNLNAIGFVHRESGTSKLIGMFLANFKASTGGTPPAVWVATYTNETTFGAVQGTEFATVNPTITSPFAGVIWLRATDNNTNLIYEYSYDRQTWVQLASVSRTAHMAGAPNQVGIACLHQSGSIDSGGWIVSWRES